MIIWRERAREKDRDRCCFTCQPNMPYFLGSTSKSFEWCLLYKKQKQVVAVLTPPFISDPAADVQADPYVLQLLQRGARPVRVPIRTQTGLPSWTEPPRCAALLA